MSVVALKPLNNQVMCLILEETMKLPSQKFRCSNFLHVTIFSAVVFFKKDEQHWWKSSFSGGECRCKNLDNDVVKATEETLR